MTWEVGLKIVRPHNPDSGVGVIVDMEGRFVDVFFPDTLERLRLTKDPAVIQPVVLKVGDVVRTPKNEVGQIESIHGQQAILTGGRAVGLETLWPVMELDGPVTRFSQGKVSPHEEVLGRIDGTTLLDFRREGQVAGLLGGRIELFAHQFDTALRAAGLEEVRWLLADEVGLGKTIVAHMIISSMLRQERIQRVVILTPESLSVQWLGELYRKFHQVFVLIDAQRLEDVTTDFGPQANPFEVYPLSITSFETLGKTPGLLAKLNATAPQMIALDEAHQVLSPTLSPVILPLIERTTHALLLTATPFQLGEQGFLRLIEAARLPHTHQEERDVHFVRQVSAVTREEVKGLPVRVPRPVEVGTTQGNYGPGDARVTWLTEELVRLQGQRKKALIFVNSAKQVELLKARLERMTHLPLFAFHEQMDTATRDIELSRFRLSSGSPALVTSGAGSEGRNFQFCDVLVHMELPSDPTVLEQRIGRLDRIGRQGEVPICYFIAPKGPTSALAYAYESLRIFEDASVGSSPAMSMLREHFETPEQRDLGHDKEALDVLLGRVEAALVQDEARWIFPDSHDPSTAKDVLGQIPPGLEQLTERFCVEAAEQLGVLVVEKDGQNTYAFEQGGQMTIEAIPGVPDDAIYLGTFDREEAVRVPEHDFFANGHPLVEGLLMELEDSTRGLVGTVMLETDQLRGLELPPGIYLLAIQTEPHRKSTTSLFGLLSGTEYDPDGREAMVVRRAIATSKQVPREVKIPFKKLAADHAELLEKVESGLKNLTLVVIEP